MDSSSSSSPPPESPEDGNDRLIDWSPETTGNTENAEDSEIIWSNSTLVRRLDIEEPTSPLRVDTGPNPVADEDLQNMDDLLNGASSTYGHPALAHHQLFLQEQQGQDLLQYSLSAAAFSRFRSTSPYRSFYSYSLTDNSDIDSVSNVISYIDSFTSRKKATDHDATETCVICMSNYIENEELRELRCTHKFHTMCIDEWLVISSLCPICRTDFPGQSGWEPFEAAPTREFNFDMMLNNP